MWAPAYYLGRALHALQDSFAHTIRSDDLSQIRHVLNYVDAIEGHLSEARDGLPHSAHMDSCDGDTLPIVMTAVTASAELIAAVNLTVAMRSVQPTQVVLEKWLKHEPGCTIENDYCDSAWVALARQEQTGPYLEEVIGCRQGPTVPPLMLTLLLLGTLAIRRRQRARHIVLTALLAVCIASTVQAETFIRTESHISTERCS